METSSVDLDSIDRLDVFYFHAMKVRSKYPSLAKLLELMLTLSHGQADVERGFSTNKSVIEDNISELSVVSKRLVRDHYNANKSFEVNQKVIISCRHARFRYTEYLKEKRDLANETSNEAAREILNSEITDLSDKINSLTKTRDHLYKKFEEIISRADPTKFDELSVAVSEAQALKKANEQTGDIEKLRESLDILKVKRKKL